MITSYIWATCYVALGIMYVETIAWVAQQRFGMQMGWLEKMILFIIYPVILIGSLLIALFKK